MSIVPFTITDFVQVCEQGLNLLTEVSQNAPLGVGTACSMIHSFLTMAKDMKDSAGMISGLTNDITAIVMVLVKIKVCSGVIEKAIQNIEKDMKTANDTIKTWYKWGFLRRFLFGKRIKIELNDIRNTLTQTKLTLTLTLTAFADPRHVIPGSCPGTVSCCAALSGLYEMGDNRCMIESKSTRTRCDSVFPRYALISKKNTQAVIYHVCGKCAKDSRSAWWKNAYLRIDLVTS